jgi:hypothetical protein
MREMRGPFYVNAPPNATITASRLTIYTKSPFHRHAVRLIVPLAAAAAAVCAHFAHAARPFVTDDARVVDEGGYQIETFVKRQRGFHENEFWLVPAHNPGGPVEFTLGGSWTHSGVDGNSRAVIAQAKTLLLPLKPNGAGYAITLGVTRLRPAAGASAETDPYINGIGSFSFADDATVVHANLGARRDDGAGIDRGTWGLGAEIRLNERLFGIAETYGERGQKPTRHLGLRYWLFPNRVQLDSTLGFQDAVPQRRFNTVGVRVLF